MITTQDKKGTEVSQEQIDSWFAEFIHGIKVDKLTIETATASKETANLYLNAITGNVREVVKTMRSVSNKYFIEQVTLAFINEMVKRNAKPKRLAFSLTPSTILVWAEIKDDDQNVQDQLILTEAKVNSEFKDAHFALDVMVVEESDKIKVPRHYITLQSILGNK
jgi:hypothetical protein